MRGKYSGRSGRAVALVVLVALLTGCVSTVNEDNALTVPKRGVALTTKALTQTFIAREDGLDGVQVALRAKGGKKPSESVMLTVSVRDISSDTPPTSVAQRLELTDDFVFYTLPFPVQRRSKDHEFELRLTIEGRARGGFETQAAVAPGNPYAKGRARGAPDIGPEDDLLFRTQINMGAGTAFRAFAGRLLADSPFLVFYALLVTGLCAALVVVWRKPMSKQS